MTTSKLDESINLTTNEYQQRSRLRKRLQTKPAEFGFSQDLSEFEIELWLEQHLERWTNKKINPGYESNKKLRKLISDENRIHLLHQARVFIRERFEEQLQISRRGVITETGPKVAIQETEIIKADTAIQKKYRSFFDSKQKKRTGVISIWSKDFRPELKDTRSWSMIKWCKYFENKTLLKHQIEDHEILERENTLLNDPRQHGKSVYVIQPRLLRKLCESVLDFIDNKMDKPIGYITHSHSMAKRMVMSIRSILLTNERIIRNYGHLVDLRREDSVKLTSNTQRELRLITMRDPQLVSLEGTSIDSGLRGSNIYELYIDDPIDIKKEKAKQNVERATEDFMIWLKYKVIPLVKGWMFGIGTRYDLRDIWVQMNEMGIFIWIQRKAIEGNIPSYTIPERETDEKGNLLPLKAYQIIVDKEITANLLAPELWKFEKNNRLKSGTPTQNILLKHYIMGEIVFQQELQNNPVDLESTLKWTWLTPYTVLPEIASRDPLKMDWIISGDIASGKSKKADHTAFVLMGSLTNEFYIHDLLFGHWTGLQKQQKLEAFVIDSAKRLGINKTDIIVIIEKYGHADFFNRIKDESWIAPKAMDPSKQGEKIRRITYGIGQEMENGKIFLFDRCRNQHQLETEIVGFPTFHPDILDAANQGIYFFKNEFTKGSGILMTI